MIFIIKFANVMDTISSFKIDHTTLMPGIYYSRRDKIGNEEVTTYDIRVTRPNVETVMTTTETHTVEHLFATYLRNFYRDIIYFGPMGCRTGFYLLTSGCPTLEDISERIKKACMWTLDYEGKVPGQSAVECGNYKDLNLSDAKSIAKKILSIIK